MGRVPVVALGLGSVAGLGAARLAASHYSLMVKDTSAIFVAGPPVVERLGETRTRMELGGHAVQVEAGTVDDAVESEEEAFDRTRRFLSYLPSSVWELPPRARQYRSGGPPRRPSHFDRAERPKTGLQHAADHRFADGQRQFLRNEPRLRPSGHYRFRPPGRLAGRGAGRRSPVRWWCVGGRRIAQNHPFRRSGADVPPTDRSSGRLFRFRGRLHA